MRFKKACIIATAVIFVHSGFPNDHSDCMTCFCKHMHTYHCTIQVYVKSLVPNAPVHVDNNPVLKETPIDQSGIITLGTCSFRIDYHGGVMPESPLKEGNGTSTPREVS